MQKIVLLLEEATGVDCSDERMLQICEELRNDYSAALRLLEEIQISYNDIWSDTSSTADEVDTSSVNNTQCHRLKSMLMGQKPAPRLTVESLRAKR